MTSFTRKEILQVLACMGVDLPPHTKLPDDALDKRLKQALNSAQSLKTVLTTPPLEPSAHAAWPADAATPVYEAVRRGDFGEALANNRGGAPELYKDAFIDLRQTLMNMAANWDQGRTTFMVQDDAQNVAILCRIVSVHQIDAKTPLLVLLYYVGTRDHPGAGVPWMQAQARASDGSDPRRLLSQIHATPLEQKLLIKLLAMNAVLLPPTLQLARAPHIEDAFKASFLLPLAPLSFKDRGRLNMDVGCAVCGAKTASRCSQCLSVSYCGGECQRADWASHKPACRALSGGRWCTLAILNCPPSHVGMFAANLNRFASTADAAQVQPTRLQNDTPPPNVHGAKVFLVKIQIGLNPAPGQDGHMQIYDRQRSVQVYAMRSQNALAFRDLREEMEGPRGGDGGIKMYRYARREGEWGMGICVDRPPTEIIQW